jgi:opacity protein-like surface antigen
MMTRALLLLALVIGFGFGTAGAQTGDQPDYLRHRGFVGGGFGGAFNTGDFDDAGNSLGTEVRGGYRFHRHVAVEGQLSWFNNVGGDLGVGDLDLRALSFTANVKKFFPIGAGRWQPYLLAGIGVTRAKAEVDVLGNTVLDRTESAFTFRGGAGIEFYITPHVNLYTEATYMLLTGGLNGAGFVPLVFGAQYQF